MRAPLRGGRDGGPDGVGADRGVSLPGRTPPVPTATCGFGDRESEGVFHGSWTAYAAGEGRRALVVGLLARESRANVGKRESKT
ncbi:hypothetical protein B005_3635 [Nocardiopsis alba ATCC BAA-2165]|uniref:Uncharacterized protein n=1 Tax=Nocardiopsis alba (strain ATCC BAA-2165 / BE74) TaxID=1205910 RepID=J7LCR0_NOCAA|nr:hypothetical protein B005_3635 [Nocardiopsis alba ATCC BAA-2165]